VKTLTVTVIGGEYINAMTRSKNTQYQYHCYKAIWM